MTAVTTDPVREDWDGTPVPVERWGKDHWSTLAYVETRIVDHDGYLDPRHLRGCNGDASRYPSRLADGVHLYGHDDRDCIDDMVAAGFLTGGRATRRDARGNIKALTWRYTLTPTGQRLAAALRQWIAGRAGSGRFGSVAMEVLARGLTPAQIERRIAAVHA